jgi:chromatin segregation and condensation protein Rec8/ScpA/Scc1 (kleisin family)
LAERDRLGAGSFARGAGIALPDPVALPPLASHQPTSLARAIRRRLAALAPPVQPLVHRPVVTLREMIERLVGRLTVDRSIRFRDMLTPRSDRSEALTAFLAVLVLVRRRTIDADQADLFGEITLRPADTAGQTDDDRADVGEFAADD